MLDEAHSIKDRTTSTAKAVFALNSKYKLCLTGTPLQNRVGALVTTFLGSLSRFKMQRGMFMQDMHTYAALHSTGSSCGGQLTSLAAAEVALHNRILVVRRHDSIHVSCAAGELYSLVRFLRVFPWAYYFCKARAHVGNRCDCNSLDHLFKKDRKRCDNCGCAVLPFTPAACCGIPIRTDTSARGRVLARIGLPYESELRGLYWSSLAHALPRPRRHGPMQHYCWWNKYVANPIKKDGYQGPGRLAMRVLKEEILPAILLRRTKVQCADVLALPPRSAHLGHPPIYPHIPATDGLAGAVPFVAA